MRPPPLSSSLPRILVARIQARAAEIRKRGSFCVQCAHFAVAVVLFVALAPFQHTFSLCLLPFHLLFAGTLQTGATYNTVPAVREAPDNSPAAGASASVREQIEGKVTTFSAKGHGQGRAKSPRRTGGSSYSAGQTMGLRREHSTPIRPHPSE